MTPDELVPWFAWAAPRLLFVFGVGFLAANLKVVADLLRYQRRRRSALLTWQGPKPRTYGFSLGLGVALGLLLAVKFFMLKWPPDQLFGETMMFLYYGYAFPLSTRISRGFYDEGVWSDSGFVHWAQISALSWKEENAAAGAAPDPAPRVDDHRVTLILVSHFRSIARHLEVPGHLYGQARRLLRDRIKARDIHIGGTGLDLGSRDGEDGV
jgi:hypothetical protein